jgi:hypothetical protein
MSDLIITIIAIVMQAANLFALLSYQTHWSQSYPEYARSFAASLSSFETGYFAYATAHGGVGPTPTGAADGGLSQLQSPTPYLNALPAAPTGYAWKYGSNGNNYVCLYAVDGVRQTAEDIYRAMVRVKAFLPDAQLVISTGTTSCGTLTGITGKPSSFPLALSFTYFLLYVNGQSPSANGLPCAGTECLLSKDF